MKKILILIICFFGFLGFQSNDVVSAQSDIVSDNSMMYVQENEVATLVNINTATLEELKQLTGIGNVLAQRIVDNRPYNSLDDLLAVSGISTGTLSKIKEQGIAYTGNDEPDPIQSVELNTASLEELKKLTMIGDVLAQRIIVNRPYTSVDDLLNISGIGTSTLAKIKEQGLAYVDMGETLVDIFPDPNLRRHILKQLPMIENENSRITQENLDSIRTVSNGYSASGGQQPKIQPELKVANLDGIQRLVNLSYIELPGEDIEDISLLSGLTRLRTLSLNHNRIKDITVLANFSTLQNVYFYMNKIDDLSSLKNVLIEGELDISYNPFTDISPLENQTKLRTLIAFGDSMTGKYREYRITDITAVASMRNLETLCLDLNNISDLSPLKGLSKLRFVSFTHNLVTDVSSLNFQYVYNCTIDLRSNNILKGLYELKKNAKVTVWEGTFQ